MEYAIILSAFCIIGTIIGLYMIQSIIKKMNDESIIVYLLVLLVGFSTVLLLTSGSIDVINIYQTKPDELFKFNKYCLS